MRVIQLAERRSTDLAAARPYPVAAGNLAPLSIRRIPCASSRPEPAIDDEAGSVHVAGIVRGQEQNALGDIHRHGQAAPRSGRSADHKVASLSLIAF